MVEETSCCYIHSWRMCGIRFIAAVKWLFVLNLVKNSSCVIYMIYRIRFNFMKLTKHNLKSIVSDRVNNHVTYHLTLMTSGNPLIFFKHIHTSSWVIIHHSVQDGNLSNPLSFFSVYLEQFLPHLPHLLISSIERLIVLSHFLLLYFEYYSCTSHILSTYYFTLDT